MNFNWPVPKSRERIEGEKEFARWMSEEMLPAQRAARLAEEANPKPARRAPRLDDPAYLDGDYARTGSYKNTRWGR